MATSVLKNDFTGGIISPRLYGRYNSAPYQNGCMRLKNFAIMPQGGITRRPGTILKNTPDHTQTPERAALAGSRLIPFCLSTTMNFIIELGNNCLRVWRQDADQLMRFTIGSTVYTTLTVSQLPDVTSLYTTAEAEQVQYAQDYEHLYIAHRNHKPLVITYSEVTEGGSLVPRLTFADFEPTFQTEPTEDHPDGDTDNDGFCTGTDCPGIVFYYASRLWFASSKDHPYRLWASRPYKNSNFEMYDVEEVEDEGVSAEVIENAVRYGILSIVSSSSSLTTSVDKTTWEAVVTESGAYIFTYDGTNWKRGNVTVQLATYGISYTGTPASGDKITVRYYNINESLTRKVEVEREDNAMRLEVGSARNDEIKWLTSMGNYIIVGTASSEWIMPGTINPQQLSIVHVSDWGSCDHLQPVIAGSDVMFVQTGGKKVRSYIGGSDGFGSPDLMFGSGDFGEVRHMAFQRIPEPRLYCVMADGTLKVLLYDRQYSLMGWASWEFDGSVKDVCVTESSAGQTVYLSILRNIGDNTTRLGLEALEELDIMSATARQDCRNYATYAKAFESRITTNTYEYTSSARGSSLGKIKRIYKATLRVLNTGALSVGYRYDFTDTDLQPDEKYTETRTPEMGNMKMDDVEITVPGGFEKFIAFTASVSGTGPATITALSLLTESEA